MKTQSNTTQSSSSLKPTLLVPAHLAERDMKSRHQPARLAFLVALTLVTFISFVILAAHGKTARPPIKVSQLAGSWQATLVIDGGCGLGTKLVTFTLSSGGTGNAAALYHTPGCGNNGESGTITITSLNAAGTGTAQLNFGGSAVFNFNIQVSPSGQIFNMVDITDAKNYEEGSAIRQ
jgi:hypothetical protein